MGKQDQEQGVSLSPSEENVLTVLYGRELYGYQILKAFEQAGEGKYTLGFGSLYPTLHKLEKKGFLNSRWGDPNLDEEDGPRRKYYKMTPQGEQALLEVQRIRANLAAWQPG